ncbi:unnamed protein product [Ilex paraguariensis]|uniref:Elongation factor G-like domain-containing protein n=1 Tax=Ilex paraguariensis TaxID=185542 RepID=A0ABC8R397_9AQUA
MVRKVLVEIIEGKNPGEKVLNKIDLPGAEPNRVSQEIEEVSLLDKRKYIHVFVVGLDCSNAIYCSAKVGFQLIFFEGMGIAEILNAIVQRIPPPRDTAERPFRALIFDSYYDSYRGVVVYFRVIDGTIKKGDRIIFMASGKDYFADEIGVLSPNQLQVGELYAGEPETSNDYLFLCIAIVIHTRGRGNTLFSLDGAAVTGGFNERKSTASTGGFNGSFN